MPSPESTDIRYQWPAGSGESLASFLRSLLMMVRRRIRMILLIVLLGTSFMTFVAYSREPRYTAQALVMLEPKENRILNVEAVAAGLSDDTTMVQTQIKLLSSLPSSPAYLTHLAKQLPNPGGIEEGEEDGGFAGEVLAMLARPISLMPEDWLTATGIAEEQPAAPADPEAAKRLRQERGAAALGRALKVQQEGRSLILSINYTAKDPTRAMVAANTLADFYIQEQLNHKLSATRHATGWLEARVAELRRELEAAEQAVEQYRGKHPLLQSQGVQMSNQQMSELQHLLVSTRAARSEKETRLRYIKDLQAKGNRLEAVTEVLDSPYLSNLWQQEGVLQREEAELKISFGSKHPQLQNLIAEKQNVSEKIGREIERLVDNISNEILVLVAKERSIQIDLKSLIDQSDKAGRAGVELRQLERQAEANRKLYEDVLNRYKETKEQQEIVQPNAKIITWAEEPTKPSSVPPNLIVLVGFLSSSIMGLGLSWLLERLDKGVRSGKQLEAEFDLPCLGLVPFLRAANKRGPAGRPHRYLLAKPLSAYGETIRSVHTALRLSNVGRPPRVIQVTSSTPGEGKTVFAVSLAALLAQSGHRTLLLDLDLRHPSITREIEVPEEAAAALTRYVMGELAYDDLAYRDEESGLDIIAVRRPPYNPAAILVSPKLRDLIQRLREEYSYIVIDSPPVLGVSDSKVVSEFADTVLLIVQWGKTTLDTVHDSLKELIELKVAISGAVISQVDIDCHARYGYGGIDHHYSKYKHYYQN